MCTIQVYKTFSSLKENYAWYTNKLTTRYREKLGKYVINNETNCSKLFLHFTFVTATIEMAQI